MVLVVLVLVVLVVALRRAGQVRVRAWLPVRWRPLRPVVPLPALPGCAHGSQRQVCGKTTVAVLETDFDGVFAPGADA